VPVGLPFVGSPAGGGRPLLDLRLVVVRTGRPASSSAGGWRWLWAAGGGRVDGRRESLGREDFGGKEDFRKMGEMFLG
jgi:hypothetical protein